MIQSANILRKHLAAVALFSGVHDMRYYLNGVLVEVRATETRCAATNGNIAGVCRLLIEQAAMPDVIIPNDVVKMAVSLKSDVLGLVNDGGKWSIGGISFVPVDGVFPDYRRIVPNKHSGEAAHFQPAFVAAFAKAGKALGSKGGMIIRQNGMDAAQVQFYGNDEFVGVLMPLRVFGEKTPDLGLVQWGAERV